MTGEMERETAMIDEGTAPEALPAFWRVFGPPPVMPRSLPARALGGLLDLVYPPRCIACNLVGVLLCPKCLAAIEPLDGTRCRWCARSGATCQGEPDGRCLGMTIPPGLRCIRSAARFNGPLRQPIHALKYGGRRLAAVPLGQMIAAYLHAAAIRPDLIVPVPLHPQRRRERGYNQAELLARVVGRCLDIPVEPRRLTRVRSTADQIGLVRADRRHNVAGAFAAPHRADSLTIAIVDDVCTTGATLLAAAEPLLSAGATSVWCVSLARATLDKG